jgi:hypothetical protein
MDVGEGGLEKARPIGFVKHGGFLPAPHIGLSPRGAAKEKILAAREIKNLASNKIAEDLAELVPFFAFWAIRSGP